MVTFVLVHGAWHGPWAWARVVPLLREAGARTVTPTLTAVGDAGLHSHAAEVVAELEAASGAGDLVLVGHSSAGLVVRQAADLRLDLVSQVVLVDGWAGADGASMFTLAPDSFVAAVRAAAAASDDGRYVPAPAPARFGITDPGDVEWVGAHLRPEPLASFTETTRLTGAVDRIPGTGIHCRPATFAFAQFSKAIGYRTVGLDGPHDVMLARPAELARLLLTIAGVL